MAIELIKKTGKIELTVPTINTDINTEEIFNNGYTEGVADGYELGHEEGYDEGHTDGYDLGHNEGYIHGVSDGWAEAYPAGERAEQERFWDIAQAKGNRKNYRYAFYNTYWNDNIYNPKHNIICSELSSDMYRYSGITNTKVNIDFSNASSSYVFAASKIKTIPYLKVYKNTTFSGWFASCSSLENITFDGEIGQEIDFTACPLTKTSLLNIIEHLGNVSTSTKLKIGATNQAKLTATEIVGATQKGWSVV